MHTIIIISAILACGAAAPAYLLAEEAHVVHTIPSKSTFTQSSQVVNHGSTHVLHPIETIHTIPVVHAKTTITKSNQVVSHGGTYVHPVHSISVMPVHEVYHVPKTTVTKSNQVVNHGGTAVVHAPVVHAPVVSVAHPVVYHSSPLVTLKTGDSAVTHHSSTVHETVPVVKSLPLVTLHH
ncbi:hypothetical protein SFRURICE_019992 [Spodoptera frugiperda]|uniref:Uncharacterized protein LOC126912824 n=1 Tax=Spodoptera frugiperda TaxID=7108 RepID=A0A9R0F7I2_SPOFR|nr:uncharacterized protein LOC126912824 [Spodoptera frugiperda]KAF9791593.1 hypothetical protein SFRURICE_019992 [Spodoptera frugiperda]